ncbi:hypothetical protein WA026_018934 [Henosepilachna vigintioctopunctata]|uniref:RAD50-interacting protein 1 n=1 Tax=Henosepilachna vigintioctopunctata TaxID=420089 RepID=A0AAW1ULG9_9CUCU
MESQHVSMEKIINCLQILQKQYGSDLLNADKCNGIYNSLLKKREHILSLLNTENIESPIGKVINSYKEISNKFNEICVDSKEVVNSIESDLDNVDEVRKNFKNLLNKLNDLLTTKQYLKVIQKLEYFNVELEREYKHKDTEQCVTIFANMCEISWNLINLKSSHINTLVSDILQYWHEILKTRISKEFEDILKSIKWPFVNANFSLQLPLQNSIDKLQLLTEYLLQIELPKEKDVATLLTPIVDISDLSLPVYLLIQPLKKRFIYHFHGSRQTNRIDKPEWYFTQVLTWIRDHKEFVQKWIQPVVNKLGYYHIDSEGELNIGLVQLAVEKLQIDIPKAQYDDFTFSHTVDEALSFDKELRDSYNYPITQSGVLGVLTQAQVFIKWLTMEKKFAIEKMDNILSLSTLESSMEPFSALTSNEEEDMKVTVCADAFMTLLKRITDRYESLPQPGHRLQFLDLQLELLDDFRVRLIQIANAEEGNVIESRVPMIANTLFYMENVLVDWGNMLHYLNLYYYKVELENITSTAPSLNDVTDSVAAFESESVFTEILSLYAHIRRDLVSTMSECVINEIKSKSRNYRRELWSKMKVNKDFKSLSLTPSACPMFEVIARRLHQLQKNLASKLFSIVWKSIANQLDTFLFEDLVLDNRFNDSGARQLKYDIERNLFPLFSQFSDRPASHYPQLMSSITLLNLAKGSALLLRDTILQLEGATDAEDTRGKMLQDVGVTNFTPKMAVTILNQRTDITVDRLIID